MIVTWSLLLILNLICFAESKCSPTSYYNNCWIRRFPGLYIDINESQHRGAELVEIYREESASKCSRACCLTRNFSCNLAVYHYNTTQDSVNCFHLHCPTLESCLLRQKGNVILYNVTKGVDPDLLVFGKYFSSNVRVLPHQSSSRLNITEPFASDKRQFNRPHMAGSSTVHPPTFATSAPLSNTATSHTPNLSHSTPTFVSVRPTQDIFPVSPVQSSTTMKRPTQVTPTRDITNASSNLAKSASTKRTSTAPQSSTSTATTTTVPVFSSLPTSGSTSLFQHTSATTTWASNTAYTTSAPTSSNVSALTDLPTSTNFNTNVMTTTPTPFESAQVNPTDATSAHTTFATSQLSYIFATLASGLPTAVKTLNPFITTTTQQQPIMQSYTTTQPRITQRRYTTTTWPYTDLTNTPSPISPLTEDHITQSPKTDRLPQVITTGNTTVTEDSTGSASTRSHIPASVANTLLTPQSSMKDSQPYHNDTKGYISWNITTGDIPHPGDDGDSTPAWYIAANTILVALATCGTVAFGCCCSVLIAVSWRGRRRRKRRYHTTLRGKRGSMRLIKYVIVRE